MECFANDTVEPTLAAAGNVGAAIAVPVGGSADKAARTEDSPFAGGAVAGQAWDWPPFLLITGRVHIGWNPSRGWLSHGRSSIAIVVRAGAVLEHQTGPPFLAEIGGFCKFLGGAEGHFLPLKMRAQKPGRPTSIGTNGLSTCDCLSLGLVSSCAGLPLRVAIRLMTEGLREGASSGLG